VRTRGSSRTPVDLCATREAGLFHAMPAANDIRVERGLVIPAAEIHEAASRAGGPGGQHVNKSNTRVTLRWNVAQSDALTPAQRRRLLRRLAPRLTRRFQLVVHAGRHRSRARNRDLARERLAELVREALRRKRVRVPTAPSRGARERTARQKKRHSELKRSRSRSQRDGES